MNSFSLHSASVTSGNVKTLELSNAHLQLHAVWDRLLFALQCTRYRCNTSYLNRHITAVQGKLHRFSSIVVTDDPPIFMLNSSKFSPTLEWQNTAQVLRIICRILCNFPMPFAPISPEWSFLLFYRYKYSVYFLPIPIKATCLIHLSLLHLMILKTVKRSLQSPEQARREPGGCGSQI
jgi:hypothetical protein